jgi:hypothetical protein
MKDTATQSATRGSKLCHYVTPVHVEPAGSTPVTKKPTFYMF